MAAKAKAEGSDTAWTSIENAYVRSNFAWLNGSAGPPISWPTEVIGANALSWSVDRMERDGWLQRAVDPEDGRKRRICVTDQVQPVWEKMVACALRVRKRATVGIDEDEIDRVRKTLAKMRANLDYDDSCS